MNTIRIKGFIPGEVETVVRLDMKSWLTDMRLEHK